MKTITSLDDIRKLVRSERKKRGLTQSQAAGLSGFTQKWLSQFESGDVSPPADMVFKLMNTLGIKLFYETLSSKEPSHIHGDEELSL
jgi:transcriptional regulator with XRE-family HTH domain